MPALPWSWRATPDPDATYVVMFSKLPLRRARHIPGFLADTRRIQRQLANTDGLIGYALNAQLARKTFWTVSAWQDDESLRGFVATDPHRRIMAALRPKMGPTRF